MKIILVPIASLLLLWLTGCAVLKASPAATTNFLPFPERLQPMHERTPFNASWITDPAHLEQLREQYASIVIPPVKTEHARGSVDKLEYLQDRLKERRKEEIDEVASYMRNRFKVTLEEYPEHPLKILDKASPHSFVLELNLVEVKPTDPKANTLGTVLGFFFPGGGLVKALGTGSVAVEGILRDGATNQPLLTFKDRETDKRTPFSVKDFQMYAHVRETIDTWANQWAELLATPPDHKVEDASPISLDPT